MVERLSFVRTSHFSSNQTSHLPEIEKLGILKWNLEFKFYGLEEEVPVWFSHHRLGIGDRLTTSVKKNLFKISILSRYLLILIITSLELQHDAKCPCSICRVNQMLGETYRPATNKS